MPNSVEKPETLASNKPHCFSGTPCEKNHTFQLQSLSDSVPEPSVLQIIYCNLLRRVITCKEVEVVCPDNEKTIATCNWAIRDIKFGPFQIRVFNDPSPLNSLQATLSRVCLNMKQDTESRLTELGYGGYGKKPASDQVLSRIDIVKVFENSREKGLSDMCYAIMSIKMEYFKTEEKQWRNFERKDQYGG
jgi:hypothetical protein